METVLGCLLLGVVLAAADNYNTKQTPTTTTATTTTTTPEIDPQIPRRIIRLLIASKKIGQIQRYLKPKLEFGFSL